jgi:DNA repair protein SbcD/Mre11
MKIAITADIHLKTNKEYPERFNALKNILDQLLNERIENLIIAGDLFDIESQNYSVFDELCREKKYRDINFYIIPGNHDWTIDAKYFTAANIKIFKEPEFVTFEDAGPVFFFVPYLPGKSMGEIIAKYKESLPPVWVLIGHGDYLSGIRYPNTYESGRLYMQLGRPDIEYYKPTRVILGHIHKKMEIGKVNYTGSPCGMDINETGRKSFIILDTSDLNIVEKIVETDYIFFNEDLIVLPTSNEFDYVRSKISCFIVKWNLSKTEIPGARIRLKVKGYTSDKKKLEAVLKESFSGFTFYNNQGPDLGEVSLFNELERISIVERVKERIDLLEETNGYTQAKKDLILEQALGIILKE